MATYRTYNDAMNAIEVAIKETIKDQPELKEYEDEVFHDIVRAYMPECTWTVAVELSRRTGVSLP